MVCVFQRGGRPGADVLPRLAALLAIGAVLGASVSTGCRVTSGGTGFKPPAPFELSLPLWLTAPRGDEQKSTPVLLGMALPPELTPFGKRFADLPPWYVYGTVRCLGADEFLASGVVRTHILHDGRAEYRCVSDTLRYHVDAQRVEMALVSATQAIAQAKDDAGRNSVLQANLRCHSSGFGLFTLSGAGGAEAAAGCETFRAAAPPENEPVGWKETPAEYVVTQVGDFNYGDPLGAFRKVEEDAIAELSRVLLVRLAHLQRGATSGNEDIHEETTRETIRLKIRGVRVLRRSVDLAEGSCRVTIGMPKGGASRVK